MDIKQIAALISGTVESSSDVTITGLNGIETAKPGDLTFATDDEKIGFAEKSQAACILTTLTARRSTKPLIRVKNPKLAFLILFNKLNTKRSPEAFVHPSAQVAKTSAIGKNVHIGANVVIEDNVKIGDSCFIDSNTVVKKAVSIGNWCHIHPNVTIYPNMIINNNVTIHANCVIGSDGFGYVKENNEIYKFPQMGTVIIEDNVEIGSNTSIDRGALSNTVIGAGTKIDNLCQIAHNVKLGKNCLIAAQCGIAGSTVVDDNVTMGGQVGVADNLHIQKNAIIAAQSGVIGTIKENAVVWGYPARDLSQTKKQMAVIGWMTKNFDKLSKLIKNA